MARLGIEVLLVALTAFVAVGFIITYIMAVQLDHVTPDFPYISDTGGKVPESCVFALVCNLAALFVFWIMYVRYKHIHGYHLDTFRGMRCLNVLTMCVGVLAAFGFMLVGCFQDDAVLTVHFIGAFMVFGLGIVYQWLQTYMSFKIYRTNSEHHVGRITLCLRLLFCICSTFFFITTTIAGTVANYYYINKHQFMSDTAIWTPEDGGFALHVISTASEWAVAGSFLLYFLTFHPDFTQIRVEVNVRLRKQHFYGTHINEKTPLTL